MRITIRYCDGRPPVKVEAEYWQTALKHTNDAMAYVTLPFGHGVEAIRWLPDRQTFDYAGGNTLSQALEQLFEGAS